MSNTYTDLTSTNFPDQVDDWSRFLDPTISELTDIRRYEAYIENGDLESARAILDSNPQLQRMIINADNLNKFRDTLIALQRFYYDDVQNYLVEIVKYRNEFQATSKYQKYDAVYYLNNRAYEFYMCISNSTPIGTLPTNMTYWINLTMRGEKGESGTGLSPRGEWAEYTSYYKDDLVNWNNALWTAKRDNYRVRPIEYSDDWLLVMEFSGDMLQSLDMDCGYFTESEDLRRHMANTAAHADMVLDGNAIERSYANSLEGHQIDYEAHKNLKIDGNEV